jgi:hypothetical protein
MQALGGVVFSSVAILWRPPSWISSIGDGSDSCGHLSPNLSGCGIKFSGDKKLSFGIHQNLGGSVLPGGGHVVSSCLIYALDRL